LPEGALLILTLRIRILGGNMKNNERGGIISNLFISPAGIVLLLGVFLIGYYVGRYQNKSSNQTENLPPLPDVVTEKIPKPEDFTFFKSLTEKGNKTVSIDLKPKSVPEEAKPDKKETSGEAPKKESSAQTASKSRTLDIQIEKKSSNASAPQQKAAKRQPTHVKKDTVPRKAAPAKLRYTVQVASYPEKQQADDDAKKMRSRGYAAFVVASEIPGKGTWYRVRLGSFTNKASAERLAKEIHAKVGVSSIITLE
jgi:DedD protein